MAGDDGSGGGGGVLGRMKEVGVREGWRAWWRGWTM